MYCWRFGLRSKILIIEDNENITELLNFYMKDYFDLIITDNGEEGIKIFENQDIDLVLLDIVLPGISGLDVLKQIREYEYVPVIIISSKDLDMDKILGLKMGADDYVSKPFNPLELLARIEAQLRRYQKIYSDDIKFLMYKDLRLDLNDLVVFQGDKSIDLMPLEYKILSFFMEHPGQIFTKKQIYEFVWEDDYAYDDNTIMVHISNLKKKLKNDENKYFKTIRGLGYRFEK